MSNYRVFTPVIGERLPRIRPEEAGVHPKLVENMVDAYREKGLRIHSFLLIKDGAVYAEGYYKPFAPDTFQTIYSLSKSFTSIAVGMAADEGILSLDEKVVDIFADEVKAAGVSPGKELAALTIRDMLMMGTGQNSENFRGMDLIDNFLKVPFVQMPGKYFFYNTLATYMCSASLWKKGVDLEEYLQRKMFNKLGISGMHWQRCEKGICMGGFGHCVVPEVIAKFGVLIANNGVWNGEQILPKWYLDLATTKQIENAHHSDNPDWKAGYGYQFWMCENGSFRGDGMYGQLMVINREKNAVLAMTAFVDDIQMELSVYFDEILSKMQADEIARDDQALKAMNERLSGLACVLEQPMDDGGELPKEVLLKKYKVFDNDYIMLEQDAGGLRLVSSLYAQPIELPRGELAHRDFYACKTITRIEQPLRTPGIAGYYVKDGKLVVRLTNLEFMHDLRIEFEAGKEPVFFQVYDANNPRQIGG